MARTAGARIAMLTALAMLAFAANSVLNRVALAQGEADALGYTGIRLASGAAMLVAIVWWRGAWQGLRGIGGSSAGALALFVYALAFSVAYLDLVAGTGALLLFASVQLGMLGWSVFRGDRPGAWEWAGFGVAMLFLVALLAPGLEAPEPGAAVLMILSGFAWAAYTLIGRGSGAPLVDTCGNFLRCLPVAIVLILPGLVWPHLTLPGTGLGGGTSLAGAIYAVASGALASALGYAVWYGVLPSLDRGTAAYVQLTVPALATAGGVLFISEPLTARLVLCSIGIMAGVALALWGADRRRQAAAQRPPAS